MQKPSTCTPCKLYSISNGFSTTEGKGTSGVGICGEALGFDEYMDGLPFRPHAQAGSKLEECIRAAEPGLTRDAFLLFNTIFCNPPKNELVGKWYAESALSTCSIHRNHVIDCFRVPNGKRKVILALGNTAFQTLTGTTHSVLDVAGYTFPRVRNLVRLSTPHKDIDTETLVIGSYHPSYIKRGNHELTPLLTGDIRKAMGVAKYDPRYPDPEDYQAKANYRIVGHDQALSFYYSLRDSPKKVIAFDIETAESGYVSEEEKEKSLENSNTKITQIQFATDKYNAVVFPNCDGVYEGISKKILSLPNLMIGFNSWNFDGKLLRQIKGININESRHHDLMWCFKHWQPKLPRGLQRVACLAGFPFPWKHKFGIDMEFYGGADVCSLHFILEWLVPLMKGMKWEIQTNEGIKTTSVWDGYKNQLFGLHPIMHDAAEDGFPINNIEREALKGKLKKRYQEKDKELQGLIPLEIKNIEPKTKVEGVTEDGKVIPEGEYRYGFMREPKGILDEQGLRYNAAKEQLIAKGKDISKMISFEKFLLKIPVVEIDEETGEQEESYYGLQRREFETWVEIPKPRKKGGRKRNSNIDRNNINLPISTVNNITSVSTDTETVIDLTKSPKDPKIYRRETVTRWVRIKPFKASLEQMCRYILWKKKSLALSSNREDRKLSERYAVPTDHQGKETTAKKEVELLVDKTGDEVLTLNLEMRSLITNLRNYIPNWKPNPVTGCVHTTWGYTASSGQINSSRPNCLNISKHTEVGQEFRRIIEAPEGWEFLELDKKSFHVATMGYVANSEKYIRFSQIDPHSIFTSQIMPEEWGLPKIDMDTMSDDEIKKICKEIKNKCKTLAEASGKAYHDIRQAQAKPTVLGNQLGLGPDKLFWQNRRSIRDRAHAVELQAQLNTFDDKVTKAKEEIKLQAYNQQYLTNEFGFVDWYYDVMGKHWNKRTQTWDLRDGDEARNPIAFRVQGCAFGMIKEELFRILDRIYGAVGSDGGKDRAGGLAKLAGIVYRIFRSSIHDSLVFMLKRIHKEIILPVCLEEMNRPCGKLVNEATGPEGLRVGVEWSYGRNLQNWHETKNPEGMREGK